MQGLFRRAAASIAALVLLAPQAGSISLASVPHRSSNRAYVALASPPQRIPVKEPARVKASPRPASAIRPHLVPGTRAHGVRLDGPPMLRPGEIDRAISAARRHALQRSPAAAAALADRAVPPISTGRSVPHTPVGGTRRTQSLPSDPTGSGTGINPWWRYQEENVPGGGHVMVNVGTGNLLLQDDDMAVPHKGIAMAFRRTYNSQASATNLPTAWGNFQSLYGNGWTNTFDARFVSQSKTLKSVYDIDGARYDYSYNTATGLMTPITPGQHATMVFDGSCGWLWTKKSGTTYYFFTSNPNASVNCPGISTVGGFSGRLHQIIGRNRNTHITFSYSWDNGDASINGKVSAIAATTESGMTTTLSFADFSGRRLLQQLTYPDGVTSVSYGYDALGNLATVSRPPNNAAGIRPLQSYYYETLGPDQIMTYAISPRWNAGGQSSGGYDSDGGYLQINYNGTSAVTSSVAIINHGAVVNPTVPDGTNSTGLQAGYSTRVFFYLTEYYTTGVTTPTFRDTDGHMTNWVVDGTGRPTQTQECTKSASQGQQCMGTWITSNESWDANNNLTSEVDSRGYQTDYAYDANGNTVAVAAPSTNVITPGGTTTFRPTQLFDYDQYNNVIAYCDQRASHPGGDWTSSGPPAAGAPDALCAANASSAHAVFTFPINPAPSYEPFGQLTNIRTPLGYNRRIAYDPARQGGTDYGLPTSVTGDPIGNQPDGPRTLFQQFTYDAAGNLVCSAADGNDPTTTTMLSYDALNRILAIGDPDDSSLTNGSCAKTPGVAGSTIVTRKSYFPDGTLASTQTPAEAAAGVSTQFQYDLDGNETIEVRNHTSTPAATHKWYDGADRLVEVQQPTDANDFYGFPWTTRYLYDLTAGGTVAVDTSAPYQAFGGLFKTQELLPASATPSWSENGPSGNTNPSWRDTAGTAFDALDRATIQYRSSSIGLMPVINTYDGAGAAGLLSQTCNANNECRNFSYTERGAKYQAWFNPSSTSTQTFGYDEVGRLALAQNGNGTIADTYDADGRKISRTQTVGSNVPATLTYAYYADGLRSGISIGGPANIPNVIGYSYRADNVLRKLTLPTNTYFNFAYTGGQRLTNRSDSTGQMSYTMSYTTPGATPTSYGLPIAENAPAWQENGITYNAEGEQLGGSTYLLLSSGWAPGSLLSNAYSTRGELVSGPPALMANGARIERMRSSGSPFTGSYTFDAKHSFPTNTSSVNTCATSHCESGQSANNTRTQYQYDSTGRQVGQFNTNVWTAERTQESAKSYDAEDHLLVDHRPNELLYSSSKANAPVDFSLGYVWGPLGHPFQVGSTSVGNGFGPSPTDFQFDALYWDDDSLLFTVNSAGVIDDIKIGDFADYMPGASTPLTVWDRSHDDQVQACHSAAGTGLAHTSTFQRVVLSCTAPNSFVSPHYGTPIAMVGRGAMLTIPKGDGFSDGYNTVQGVRTYDPHAGVWNTPDAYAGEVHDPMTLKPYMWNRNNPYAYSDPSGYSPHNGGACRSLAGCVIDLLLVVAEHSEYKGWAFGSPSRHTVVYPMSAQSERQMQHVLKSHIPGGASTVRKSDGSMRSLFKAGTTNIDIRQMLIQSVVDPKHTETLSQRGSIEFELNLGHVIGTDESGKDSSTLRSVWDPSGNLVTAYPIPNPR